MPWSSLPQNSYVVIVDFDNSGVTVGVLKFDMQVVVECLKW